MNRRAFLSAATATAGLALARPVFGSKVGSSTLSHKERVDRALRGQDLDRPPFTFYHHYKSPTGHRTISSSIAPTTPTSSRS